jgi:hypothetical protein
MKPSRLVFVLASVALLIGLYLSHAPLVLSVSGEWKITSIKVCRSSGGTLVSRVQAIGSYPVYSFFIPRPVWTVNGALVDAQPVYDRGKLVEFTLLGAVEHLKSGAKNSIKFSLPDQTGAKVFYFNESKVLAGECYEFF